MGETGVVGAGIEVRVFTHTTPPPRPTTLLECEAWARSALVAAAAAALSALCADSVGCRGSTVMPTALRLCRSEDCRRCGVLRWTDDDDGVRGTPEVALPFRRPVER